MQKLAIAATILALTAGCFLSGQDQSALAESRLPQDIVQRLEKLKTGLADQSRKSQDNVAQLERYRPGFQILRDAFESDPALRSTKSANYLRVAVDSLELSRRVMQSDADLNRKSLDILVGVNTGLVAGESYIALDRQLLMLEQAEPQRSAPGGQIGGQLDQIDALLTFSDNAPDSGRLRDLIRTARAALVSLRLTNNENNVIYSQVVKPATASLRVIVDKLPKL